MGNTPAKEIVIPDCNLYHRTWDPKAIKGLIAEKKLAPVILGSADPPSPDDLEECPICFLFYPLVNRTKCCHHPICSECLLQIKTTSHNLVCPFCKSTKFAWVFTGPMSEEEKRAKETEKQKVKDLELKMRQEEEERDKQREAAKKKKILEEEERKRLAEGMKQKNAADEAAALLATALTIGQPRASASGVPPANNGAAPTNGPSSSGGAPNPPNSAIPVPPPAPQNARTNFLTLLPPEYWPVIRRLPEPPPGLPGSIAPNFAGTDPTTLASLWDLYLSRHATTLSDDQFLALALLRSLQDV